RRITRCDFGDARENTLQSGRGSNNLFKHRRFVDFFSQGNVFMLESLLNAFAFINICSSHIPSNDVSLFVVHGVKAGKEPTVTTVSFAHPDFGFKSRAAQYRATHGSLELRR